jgi:hypothetical protein
MGKKYTQVILVLIFTCLATFKAFAATNEFEGACNINPANLPDTLKTLIQSANQTSALTNPTNHCKYVNIGFFPSAAPNWLEIKSPDGRSTVFAYVTNSSQEDANNNIKCTWQNVTQKIKAAQSVNDIGYWCNNQ